MRAHLGLILVAAVALTGCTEPVSCTLEARAGLSIEVSDRDTGAPIVDATVTASAVDRDYIEVLESFGDGSYSGAWELDGTYVVTVEAPGYVPVTLDSVTVEQDECHVITEQRVVRLGM